MSAKDCGLRVGGAVGESAIICGVGVGIGVSVGTGVSVGDICVSVGFGTLVGGIGVSVGFGVLVAVPPSVPPLAGGSVLPSPIGRGVGGEGYSLKENQAT